MQKFLNIKGDAAAAFEGNQLVAIEGIKTVRAATATATTCVIAYNDGTATTITTAATTNFAIQVEVQAAIKAALATSWTNPVYDLTLSLTPVSVINA